MSDLSPSSAALQARVSACFADRGLLADPDHREAVLHTVALLDRGALRVATPNATGEAWTVHAWVKQAILLFFATQELRTTELGPFEFHDKIALKRDWAAAGVRVVPPATARYGSFIESGAVLMPSYVNIGAWVGGGTMVDTWATVGSCAQIGRHVHLSGGVGIGGVLEPPGAAPVIVEDGCFLGSRAIVVEGVHLEREVVLGANVTLTASTPIIDVTGREPITHRGRVPARSVVVPGTRTKEFPAGNFQIACALIIGRRKDSTDQRTSLNQALRDFDVPV
ncbi:2,3,4,5-tetrahydropyridine-2,6-dicarboxylate N-succinyltransferase [Nannocystis sp.]|uniref:2,3,4,5-tetrahydropyridine-2,6-dicarboxylate N-succinyltransferase n=1 Tax=Nannocystis sp. TaxID=1962667 RepID=UPI0024239BE8|nr:2,3,4,5-tetrahydropyridine-2,6-dicarboxylate N-succinyltransferase [Nannocystis sp.]MBK7824527.1 2,3,4,5-tetrahydropyridine-2,6-dicarboxylate N-succinyltransferase [Nannocystis sp.]MBK9753222.1 2,3,4,5-tetrahydropyridine-2,6-dicarboxylate N-succinyltransferase [Nannocystis sp.]